MTYTLAAHSIYTLRLLLLNVNVVFVNYLQFSIKFSLFMYVAWMNGSFALFSVSLFCSFVFFRRFFGELYFLGISGLSLFLLLYFSCRVWRYLLNELNFELQKREKNVYKAVVVVLAFYARPFETLRITPKLGFFSSGSKSKRKYNFHFSLRWGIYKRAKDTSWLLLDINLCYLQQFSVILLSNFFFFFFFLMLKAIRL